MPPNTLRVNTDSHAEIVEVEVVSPSIVPSGNFAELKSYCHLYGAEGQRQAHLLLMPRRISWARSDCVRQIVRVQYFVRGGFVGHRSRVSSKHLSSHLPVDGVRFLGRQKGLRCSCKMHVWVSGPTKMPTTLDVRRSDVTALALSYRTFQLRKV
ncbi:uncharacterized protein TNCV_819581 [Trichonephila clavipes]|nr:uncharacterized protein TNCV_819581 [Trichonephila clavipes]